ncbi:MAG: glycerophosphodiester phosphodiesterase [Gemmatimonadetes bacterium]|nr:glycerophosphodiester phosphodiesterase [Gemmatimonadota bacterium]
MPPKPERIAHRGAPRELRENTLPSFLRALDRGADAIELDVHATADGVVVVHHDPRLKPDTARPLYAGQAIRELPWAVLQRVLYRDGHGLPTLAEVLEAVGSRGTVYVEVKQPGIEAEVIEVLRASKTRTAVHAFDHRVVRRVHELAPEIPTGALVDAYLLDPVHALRGARARDFWPSVEFTDAALIDAIHAAGGRVIAWTANDPAAIAALTAAGIDGLCTDDVRLLDPA